jgi:nitrite reductase/ring-hydroxylating ferredoxin subunit
MKTIDLCKTSDVAEGSAIKVEKEGLSLAIFNLNGAFYVLDDMCSHGPGSLSEGYIKDDTIECDFHNGAFNIRTGEVVEPPCLIPQKTYKVVVHDDTVGIEI